MAGEKPTTFRPTRLLEAPKRIANAIGLELQTRLVHSRLVTPLPHSLKGFSLQLTGNTPTFLTPQEYATSEAKIEREREKLARQESFFNPVKVNITSAHVITAPTGEQVIQYTTAPTTYIQHRAGIDGTTPYETARKLTHSGASIIALTGDGMIALSSRPDNVQLYPRALAGTASGSWDGELQSDSTLLVPPTPDKAVGHIKKELHEETGLPYGVINAPDSHLTIMGIAEDGLKKHWDILYMIQLPKDITVESMRAFYNEDKTNGNGHSKDPIPGHLNFIPAKSEVVGQFLTNMHSPWDATARTALLLTGYMLKMQELVSQGVPQEKAVRSAIHWKNRVQRDIFFNQLALDRTARRFRKRNIRKAWRHLAKAVALTALGMHKEKDIQASSFDLEKYRRRPKGSDVHRTPRRQGQREVKDELIRNGFSL